MAGWNETLMVGEGDVEVRKDMQTKVLEATKVLEDLMHEWVSTIKDPVELKDYVDFVKAAAQDLIDKSIQVEVDNGLDSVIFDDED